VCLGKKKRSGWGRSNDGGEVVKETRKNRRKRIEIKIKAYFIDPLGS